MKEEWRKQISNWESVRNYRLHKQKLKMNIYNKEQLIKACQAMNEYHSLPLEDKESLDFLEYELMSKATLNDLLESYIQTILQWNYYQIRHELVQEFEICAMLRDVIAIEKEEMLRLLETYFPNSEFDLNIIDQLNVRSRETAQENYEQWNHLIKIQQQK